MTTLVALHEQHQPTTDRVAAAWAAAHPVTKRAVLAACATAVAAGTAAPLPASLRVAVAATGVLLAVAALVDVHEHKLPNRLLAMALAATAVGLAASGKLPLLNRAALGLVLAGGLMLFVRLTRGVGMGDVKMAAVVGATTAPTAVVAAPLAIAVAALVASGYGVMAHRSRLALGPALWLGWAVALGAAGVGWLS